MRKNVWTVIVAAATLAAAGAASAASSPLLGYWPMNERTGQVVYDWSGNGNHGRLGSETGVDANDPTRITGIFGIGRALRFAGDDFVAIRDSPVLEPAHVTVEAWVRGSASPGRWRYVVSKGAVACEAGSYGLYTGFGGGMAFYISDGGAYTISPAASAAIWDGRWHHVAGTFDGTTVGLFVDGRAVGTGTTASTGIGYDLPDGDAGYIGAYRGTCDLMMVGDIDEVRIWNRALPIAAIADRIRTLLP